MDENNWQRINIKSVCSSIIDCVNKTAKTVDYKTPYKMLRTTNIKNGWVDVENVNYVTEEIYKKWTRRQVPEKGDVILTREAPLGEVGILRSDDKVFLGQRLVAYRVDPKKLDNKFLFYSFLSHDLISQIKSFGSGSTVEHMRVPDAEKLTLSLPPLELQKKISSIISAYDDLIENNEKRIKVLEEMAQRLYTEWFVKFKFPGHEKVKMVDSGTEYSMIPEGWMVKPLAQAVLINPITKINKSDDILHIPMECLSNILSVIDINKTFRNASTSGPKFKNGDTLFARITPCLQNGKTGYVNMLKNGEVACGSTEFVVLRSKMLTSIYIYLLVRTDNFRETARMTMVGASGRQRVRSEFFETYKVLVPDERLLTDFESRVSKYFSEILILYRSNITLSKTRDLLIPQLVTGRRELKSSSVKSSSISRNKDLFRDAVIFSYYVKSVSTPNFNPTHLRSVKNIYFANRLLGCDPTQKYSVQQFGPYDPKSKYGGGEKIAQNKKYVERVKGGFKPGSNISEISKYTYDELDAIDKVLSSLKYKKDVDLELMSTVDYAVYDSKLKNNPTTPQVIFDYIRNNSVWAPKIDRLQLSVEKIGATIEELKKLIPQGLTYPEP